jgi:Mor family transcriptional regulator
VVYLPKERWELGRRNQEIKAQWGKKQIRELAEMYHLDESSVYRILKYGRNYTPPEIDEN